MNPETVLVRIFIGELGGTREIFLAWMLTFLIERVDFKIQTKLGSLSPSPA